MQVRHILTAELTTDALVFLQQKNNFHLPSVLSILPCIEDENLLKKIHNEIIIPDLIKSNIIIDENTIDPDVIEVLKILSLNDIIIEGRFYFSATQKDSNNDNNHEPEIVRWALCRQGNNHVFITRKIDGMCTISFLKTMIGNSLPEESKYFIDKVLIPELQPWFNHVGSSSMPDLYATVPLLDNTASSSDILMLLVKNKMPQKYAEKIAAFTPLNTSCFIFNFSLPQLGLEYNKPVQNTLLITPDFVSYPVKKNNDLYVTFTTNSRDKICAGFIELLRSENINYFSPQRG